MRQTYTYCIDEMLQNLALKKKGNVLIIISQMKTTPTMR